MTVVILEYHLLLSLAIVTSYNTDCFYFTSVFKQFQDLPNHIFSARATKHDNRVYFIFVE